MDLFRFLKAFTILLLVTTYCESQPVEFIPEQHDDAVTTICPEELAKNKLENLNTMPNEAVNVQNENLPLRIEDENEVGKIIQSSLSSEEATTICPEELERRRLEDILNTDSQDNGQEELESEESASQSEDTATVYQEGLEKQKLQEILNINSHHKQQEKLELVADENASKLNKEDSEEGTTICPEELEKRKLEGFQESIKIIPQKSDILENEVLKTGQQNNEVGPSLETTTICPEELQNKLLNDIAEKATDALKEDNELLKTMEQDDTLDLSREGTTICPEEELEKIVQDEKRKNSLNKIIEKTTSLEGGGLLKNDEKVDLSRKELEQMEDLKKIDQGTKNLQNDNILANVVERNAQPDKPSFENFVDDSTTDSQEFARQKLKQSQKYLTKFKEIIDQAQKRKASRRKRQTSDYSYYANQPNYNSQGVAVSSSNDGLSQHQSSYNPQGYNLQGQTAVTTKQSQPNYQPQGYSSQTYTPQAIKTYQQIRKQHQTANPYQKQANFYPKTYQNSVKPVKTYRNPSTYMRYSNNGNLNNYYRLNSVGNRRQFQGARPVANTSRRPNIRVTRKKKFKPSPVFA